MNILVQYIVCLLKRTYIYITKIEIAKIVILISFLKNSVKCILAFDTHQLVEKMHAK